MTRKLTIMAAAVTALLAGAVTANAASFSGAGSAPASSMIQNVHMGDGPHPHPHPWGPGPRWGDKWGPHGPGWGYGYGPRPVSRCSIVRARCSELFRPGGFRWERCVENRGC